MQKTKSIALILGVLTMSILVGYFVLAWTEPTTTPPGGNVPAPLNIGSVDQIKSGGLSVGAFVSRFGTILARDSGNVGIGTTTPGAKLEVAGQVKITGGSPAAGKVLTSDVTGLASWQTITGTLPSGTSGQTLRHDGTNWVANSVLYNNGTNVGIGTASPGYKLDIAGDVRWTGILQGGSVPWARLTSFPSACSSGQYVTAVGSTLTCSVPPAGIGGSGTTNYLAKFTAGTTIGNSQIYDNGANVGIGTAGPTIKLAIGDTDTGLNWAGDGQLDLYSNNVNTLSVRSGNVGIGTASPGVKLEVAGQIKITGGTPGINKVLTSDASGLATWEEPASGVPSGTITAYGGSSAPSGWLMCNGSAVSRTTYAGLFAVISTTYGAGDGSTTFNVPNLQQRFPLGKAAAGTGSTLGGTGGAIDHTHTGPSHTHTGPSHTHSFTPAGTVSTPTFTGTAGTTGSGGVDHTHTAGSHTHTYNTVIAHTHTVSGTAASAGAHSHTISIGSGGSHSHTISIGSGGSHNHSVSFSVPDYYAKMFYGYAYLSGGGYAVNGTLITTSHGFYIYTGSSGEHTHSASASTGGSHTHSASAGTASDHAHTVSGSAASTGSASGTTDAGGGATGGASAYSHTHSFTPAGSNSAPTFTGTAGTTGSSGTGSTGASGTEATGSNNPPYLVVNYIIKY